MEPGQGVSCGWDGAPGIRTGTEEVVEFLRSRWQDWGPWERRNGLECWQLVAWGEEEVVTKDLSSLVIANGLVLIIVASFYWILFAG